MKRTIGTMLARHRFHDITAEEAVATPKALVDAGSTSAAVFDLSLSSPDRVAELDPFMVRIAKELGLTGMTHEEAFDLATESLVTGIANKNVDPFEGGYRIWLYNGGTTMGMPVDLRHLVTDALSDWVVGDARRELAAQIVQAAKSHLRQREGRSG